VSETTSTFPQIPVFLKLGGRPVVLVGGGAVATAKLAGLIEAGALVTVVAPEVAEEIARARATVVRREFRPGDLDGAWLVVAAAPRAVNRRVAEAAETRRVFLVAVDDPDSGSAYTGGVLRRGGLTIAIATGGRAPALAGLLREGLGALLPEDVERWVTAAHDLSQRQRAAGVPMGARRPLLLRALNELYEGRAAEARAAAPGAP